MGDLPGGMFSHDSPCLIPDGRPTLHRSKPISLRSTPKPIRDGRQWSDHQPLARKTADTVAILPGERSRQKTAANAPGTPQRVRALYQTYRNRPALILDARGMALKRVHTDDIPWHDP